MAADGTDPRRFTDDPGEDWGGSLVARRHAHRLQLRRAAAAMEIYRHGCRRRSMCTSCTLREADDVAPTWSPDGSRIGFHRADARWLRPGPVSRVRWQPIVVTWSRSPTLDDQSWTGGVGSRWTHRLHPHPAAGRRATPLVRLDLATATILLSAGLVAAVWSCSAEPDLRSGSFTRRPALGHCFSSSSPTAEWRFMRRRRGGPRRRPRRSGSVPTRLACRAAARCRPHVRRRRGRPPYGNHRSRVVPDSRASVVGLAASALGWALRRARRKPGPRHPLSYPQ